MQPPTDEQRQQIQQALGLTDERTAEITRVRDLAIGRGWRVEFADGVTTLVTPQ